MRIRAQFVIAAGFLMILPPPVVQGDDANNPKIRNSVVKIRASLRRPDVYRPWTKGSPEEVTGSGVVIAGKRILTNAHMVNHASEVFVQPDKSSDKLSAAVEAIAPGIDLAVLKLEDESFFDDHSPLPINSKLPALQQTVFTYGYPEGGTELSITRGIVSRVEYAGYYMMAEGLRVQVDAAINPGNSGGPAVADGQMIGIVFSKLEQADNIGYIIPMEEIELFFKDVQDGRYDGKPFLVDEFQNLENEALRSKLKLDKKTTGVLVRKVHRHEPSYPLRAGDVIARIGDHFIDNAGMVRVDGDRLIRFQYLVQRLTRDNRVSLTIIRDGRERTDEVPVDAEHNCWLIPFLGGTNPSYFMYGPLVFTEATDEYVRYLTYNDEPVSRIMNNLYAGNPLFTRYGERPAFPGERIVIVAHPMFSHRIRKGYSEPYADAIAEVDGVRIRNLKHLVELLRDATGEFVEIKFSMKSTDTIVFKRKEAMNATEEVLSDNGIRQQCSPDIAPIWSQKKAQ
jgi:S1-C subfamily serine protease